MNLSKIAEKIMLNKLKLIKHGNLKLVNYDGKVFQFGNFENALSADIQIINPVFFRNIVLGGSSALGEAHIQKDFYTSNLTNLIELTASEDVISTPLPYQVKHVVFNPQKDELIIATTRNKLLRYSTRTKKATTPIQLTHYTEHLQLAEDNRILVVTATNGTIVLDSQTLAPLTPIFEGRFLRPALRGNTRLRRGLVF